ncbi:hypothetical protein KSP39_PZI014266 [Platanthera zijinensis]|uniref:Urease accessory protein UreD n=1 Tax=Platanthera zijinensis TaxID=2320716 RepID=A0AAP0BBW5_9ASPA
MEETGFAAVENIDGKSTITHCFSKYPLKLIIPQKTGSSTSHAMWISSLSYGDDIISGDRLVLGLSVGDGCTVALTTQASTKAYPSREQSNILVEACERRECRHGGAVTRLGECHAGLAKGGGQIPFDLPVTSATVLLETIPLRSAGVVTVLPVLGGQGTGCGHTSVGGAEGVQSAESPPMTVGGTVESFAATLLLPPPLVPISISALLYGARATDDEELPSGIRKE